MTARNVGGGARKIYRMVDFKLKTHWNQEAKVVRIEYDPNRTAHLALLEYANEDLKYMLAWDGAKEGDVVIAGDQVPITPGNTTKLENLPVGSYIHNIEIKVVKPL